MEEPFKVISQIALQHMNTLFNQLANSFLLMPSLAKTSLILLTRSSIRLKYQMQIIMCTDERTNFM